MSLADDARPFRRLAFGPNPYMNIDDVDMTNKESLNKLRNSNEGSNGVASFLTCGIYGEGKTMKQSFDNREAAVPIKRKKGKERTTASALASAISQSPISPIFDVGSSVNRESMVGPNDLTVENSDIPLTFKNKVAVERAREEYRMVAE